MQAPSSFGLPVALLRFPIRRRKRRTCTAEENKGHAQRLRWTQRNSESNAKTIGSRTASDGEFVFSTTVKASKDEASHDCRGRIRAEFDRLVRTATPIEFFRSVSETPEGGILPCRTVSRCLQDAEHPTCPLTLAVDRDWRTESDLPTSSRATA